MTTRNDLKNLYHALADGAPVGDELRRLGIDAKHAATVREHVDKLQALPKGQRRNFTSAQLAADLADRLGESWRPPSDGPDPREMTALDIAASIGRRGR